MAAKTSWMTCRNNDMTIVLYASKLAACAGLHPYVHQQELLDEMRSDHVHPTEVAMREIDALPTATREALRNALDASYSNAEEVVDACREATSLLTPSSALAVQSVLYTRHGTEQEDVVRRSEQHSTGCKIRTSHAFCKTSQPVCVLASGARVFVGGKHDGVDADTGDIIEIKTRQRRFLGVPLYERIQLLAYMEMHGVRRGRLIESYLGKGGRMLWNSMCRCGTTLWQDAKPFWKACRCFPPNH